MKNVEILEDIGFDVVVTLTDGNEANHKLKSLTADKAFRDSIQNPFNLHRLIYMAFDPVHLFKCFYTNLQSRQTFVFPQYENHDVLLEAKFSDIKLLYEMELEKPLRKAYRIR